MNLSDWDAPSGSPQPEKVVAQESWAIVDDLGRPCLVQAILFSPQVALFPQDGELMNVTMMSSKETADRLLAAVDKPKGFHVVPYNHR